MLRVIRLLLPALVPSWRFFRAVAASPRVEVLRDGAWREVRPRPQKVSPATMLRRMVWNPGWNETLYLVTLAERIVESGSERAARDLLARVDARDAPVRLVFVRREGARLTREILWQHPQEAIP